MIATGLNAFDSDAAAPGDRRLTYLKRFRSKAYAAPRVARGRRLSVCSRNAGVPNDPQIEIGRLPTLFAQAQSQDRQAPQPRHVPDPHGRREA
jgi:hypothetical protein